MSTPDHGAHGLAAAYALDALDDAERQRMEDHLQQCDDCRRDVQEFRETAAGLAEAESREPPARLWEHLSRTLPHTRQLPPAAEAALDPQRRGRWFRAGRLGWVVAAAALAAAVVLGVVYAEQRARFTELAEHTEYLAEQSEKIDALIAAEDASMSEGELGEDAQATIVSSQEYDMALVVVEGLPPAPEGMLYQMWYFDDVDGTEKVRPAGMLYPSEEEDMQSGVCDQMGSAHRLGVTVEPEGGMPEPSGEPMIIDVYHDDAPQDGNGDYGF
jgi:anti-sigma-K factor RskA